MNEKTARDLVYARSNGICEVCSRARGMNWHHRKNQGQGGDWCPTNGLHVCGSGTTGCHGHITTHPAASREQGLGCPVLGGSRPHTCVAGRSRLVLPRVRRLDHSYRKEGLLMANAHCPTCTCRQHTRPAGGAGRLTNQQVSRIRAHIRMNKTDRQIAEQFGVTVMTVNSIRNRRSWSNR